MVTPRILSLIILIAALTPAHAQDDLTGAPPQLSIPVTKDAPTEQCRRLDNLGPDALARVSLHRTFYDDFDESPLKSGK